MKKLAFDSSNWKLIGTINDLIDLVNSQQDLVNSQQEAIKELRAGNSRDTQHQHDNVEAIGELQTEIGVLRNMVLQSQEAIEKLQEHVDHEARHVSEPADDTHRTVTLRIPKGMRVGDAFNLAYLFSDSSWEEFITRSDTDLQKALDEVQPNE